MVRHVLLTFVFLILFLPNSCFAFQSSRISCQQLTTQSTETNSRNCYHNPRSQQTAVAFARRLTANAVDSVESATQILSDWDRLFNPDQIEQPDAISDENSTVDMTLLREAVPTAVQLLNQAAASERNSDPRHGRCMLGICANNASQGVAALKSWVSALQLPRGLLHGMDKDGVPIELEGGVYIKYNTGGSLTFADLRKSGVGLDALWKPGDALLEQYDGKYRGVYFQVELQDGIFRQFLLPLDTFDPI